MVRMGVVWDRTVDVLQGRGGILARLAALYLFVPGVVSAGVRALATPGSALAIVAGIVSLASMVLLVAGVLAITAVATDPQVDTRRAGRLAFSRLLPALGVVALLVLVLALLCVPIGVLVAQSGATLDPVTQRFDLSAASGTALNIAGALAIVAFIAGLWVSAGLAPLFAVILNERFGVGAIARSFRLARGSVLRLIGVLILYAIVIVVALSAATSVAGVVAGLVLGADAAAGVGFVVGVVSALLTAVATVVQSVFYARFYVAAREREAARADEGAVPDATLPR